MNVVVTGGAGYVGSAVVRKLLDRGWWVRVVDEFADAVSALEASTERVEFVHAEPGEIQPRWLEDMDAVVHVAGLGEWAARNADFEAHWPAHAVATERLALACRMMRVPRLTYGSTCDVYATLPAGYQYDESVSARPRSAFAVSKYYGEQRLQQLTDDGFCPVILRHAVPYGLSPRPLFETAPNRFVLDAVARGHVALPADAWITRPFVDVEDVAEAHVRCLEAQESRVRGQVFNVVHVNLRIREVGSLVADSVGRSGGYVRLTAEEAPDGGRDCRCSASRLRTTLGFSPERTLEAAVVEMAEHLAPANRGRIGPAGAPYVRRFVEYPARVVGGGVERCGEMERHGGRSLRGGYSCWVES